MGKEILGSLELNRVYQMDCIEGMKMIPDKSVNLIIADPPYFGVVKDKWDNQWKTEEEYLKWCIEWMSECKRVLKDDGSIYIWGMFPIFHSLVHIAKQYFIPLQESIWYKPNGRPVGGKKKFRILTENCATFVNDPKNYTFNADDVREPYKDDYETILKKRNKKDIERGYKPDPRGKLRGNVWIYGVQHSNGHPTSKHLNICETIIKVSSNENDIVLIPFCGSGSECVIAKSLNRKFISFELESEYIELANMRLDSVEE